MLHIKIKRVTNAATWKQILCLQTPYLGPPPLPQTCGWGQKVKIKLFQNMVILHLKLNAILNCSSSKYFAGNPKPLTLGVKIQLFQNNFMLHVKLKGITNAATWSQIFCLQTAPYSDTGVGIKRSKLIFIRTWSCCKSN